ncbi:MAG: succinate-semialdehyde dehydrogenase/glutarate-semialdehyde dehydrogenase [Verrucomicrobiales bacterium]|jgi:succinate-semialdehyde dehydrogenase/glutarate-semialdehyde dehydrogenase
MSATSVNSEVVQTISPTTGQVIDLYKVDTEGVIREKIEAAQTAFLEWSQGEPIARTKPLLNVANLLEKNKQAYAELMAREMGKTMKEGIAEIEKCSLLCRYYIQNAPKLLRDETTEFSNGKSYVSYQPLGAILAVMPWNFPFWQVFRFAAPNLVAGNVCVLKHASNVPRCALAIQAIFLESGFPIGTFTTTVAHSDQVAFMIEHSVIQGVTLTGSTPAGRKVAAQAGQVLKKTVLELGGSDPYIILEDADLDLAAEVCVTARLMNTGQSCIAAKRFIVVNDVHDDFVERISERMQQIVLGDPLDDATGMGPMARHDLRNDLHAQVEKSVQAGAKCLLGGSIPTDAPLKDGAYYPPTILTNVKPGMPAYEEELFGPVAAVIRSSNEADAIRIANDTEFGLGAAVFTSNVERGERIARDQLQAGSCAVNRQVASDARLPFGGIKSSGYGRELAKQGLHAFLNVKTIEVS